MTKEQTRQLGIEFERRLFEMYPQFRDDEKLDTDTIYSFLSEYQTKYIKDIYMADEKLEGNSAGSRRVNDIIKSLVSHQVIQEDISRNSDSDLYSARFFKLPSDYFLYIRSNSFLIKTYKHEKPLSTPLVSPNHMIRQQDVPNVINTFYNQRSIIRNPLVIMESIDTNSPYLKLIYDDYTIVTGIDLIYYKQPYAFNVLKYDDDDVSAGAVHSTCELPFSCFDELLEGALNMYIENYKFKLAIAANKNRRQQTENKQ